VPNVAPVGSPPLPTPPMRARCANPRARQHAPTSPLRRQRQGRSQGLSAANHPWCSTVEPPTDVGGEGQCEPSWVLTSGAATVSTVACASTCRPRRSLRDRTHVIPSVRGRWWRALRCFARARQRAPQSGHVWNSASWSHRSMVVDNQSSRPRAVTKSGVGRRPAVRHRSTAGDASPTRSATAVTPMSPSGRGRMPVGGGKGPCAAVWWPTRPGGTW